nr:MAG TPA: hypothetical protein [Caudoviricetes sp.]
MRFSVPSILFNVLSISFKILTAFLLSDCLLRFPAFLQNPQPSQAHILSENPSF